MFPLIREKGNGETRFEIVVAIHAEWSRLSEGVQGFIQRCLYERVFSENSIPLRSFDTVPTFPTPAHPAMQP